MLRRALPGCHVNGAAGSLTLDGAGTMASCNGEVLEDHTPRANRPLVQEVGETLKKGSTETMDC